MLTSGVCLLPDNALPHVAPSTTQLLDEFGWDPVLTWPLQSIIFLPKGRREQENVSHVMRKSKKLSPLDQGGGLKLLPGRNYKAHFMYWHRRGLREKIIHIYVQVLQVSIFFK
uniref:Histone-lysine N-methyltransferase SETMAR n=2 Tax=Lygus hesperus TaxID=30085 RepID=A0A0K8TGF4_LYGHE